MNGILNKLRQSEAFDQENRISYVKAIVMMGMFTFRDRRKVCVNDKV